MAKNRISVKFMRKFNVQDLNNDSKLFQLFCNIGMWFALFSTLCHLNKDGTALFSDIMIFLQPNIVSEYLIFRDMVDVA